MAVVHVPTSMRSLAGGRDRIEAPGATLRQVLRALAAEYPDLAARIVDEDDLRADMAVAVDGSIIEAGGLYADVRPDAEVYLVPPIGGG